MCLLRVLILLPSMYRSGSKVSPLSSVVAAAQEASKEGGDPAAAPAGDSPAEEHQDVRNILVLPKEDQSGVADSAKEQLKLFTTFMDEKMKEYRDVLSTNSTAVFAVNYMQNRHVQSELFVEIAKLFEVLKVKEYKAFENALSELKNDAELESIQVEFEKCVEEWGEFLKEIDTDLDSKIGACPPSQEEDEDLSELGMQSKAIILFVKESNYPLSIITVVKTFTSAQVNDHILALHSKMCEFHSLGCDVTLLSKGPPLGSRGGSYLKLIGVPFRKLYDETEAEKELKAHRRPSHKLCGWKTLLKLVEVSLSDDRPRTAQSPTERPRSALDDTTVYVAQKGGTILVNRNCDILFKFIEEEGSKWPSIDDLLAEVRKHSSMTEDKKEAVTNKVDSEVSAAESEGKKEKKACCTIL